MQPGQSTVQLKILRVTNGRAVPTNDTMVVEEPLEIRLTVPHTQQSISIAVTMRTPGNDYELAAGFLFSEGIIPGTDAVEAITYCVGPEEQEYNVLSVTLRPGAIPDLSRIARSFTATASCGLCGKTSIDEVRVRIPEARPAASFWQLTAEAVTRLPEVLTSAQAVFARTGGLHAAALCHPDGSLITLREDVGRHDAVDKAIGERLLARRLPLMDTVLVLSGRAGFELIQKAAVAQVPVVVAIGAPSSLAVDLAQQAGMTLIGFTRGASFNVYTGRERIAV